MASQREQSRLQRVEFDRQSFDGSFFPFLASLRQTQSEFRHAGQADVEAVTGFVAANRLKDEFIAHMNQVKTEPSILDDQTGRLLGLAFERYVEQNAWFLEIYPVASHVKSLLSMIEHLEETYRGVDLPFRKDMYIEIVRGQLNSSWMALLLLHGLSVDIELKLQIDQSDLARHMRKGVTYKLCAPYYSSLASPSFKNMQ